MTYKLIPTPRFKRQLRKLDPFVQDRIKSYLDVIAHEDNPRIRGKALKGPYQGLWRYRIGEYRVIVQINADNLTILGINLGHKSQVYRLQEALAPYQVLSLE